MRGPTRSDLPAEVVPVTDIPEKIHASICLLPALRQFTKDFSHLIALPRLASASEPDLLGILSACTCHERRIASNPSCTSKFG